MHYIQIGLIQVYIPYLSRVPTVSSTLVRRVCSTIITTSTSIFRRNQIPVSSYMVTINPRLSFSHASQIKDNWISSARSIKVCLVIATKQHEKLKMLVALTFKKNKIPVANMITGLQITLSQEQYTVVALGCIIKSVTILQFI